MNSVGWFLTGIGSSGILGVPLVLWAIKKGKQAYSNARIRGTSGKLFKQDELENLLDPKMIPKLQKSRYWQILQFSQNREEYEKKLESLIKMEYKKIFNLSSKEIQPFLKIYYVMFNELYDLKLILYCVENNRNREELKKLLRSAKYVELLKYSHVDEVINHLIKINKFNFLDFFIYNKYGLLGIEYALDYYYFKLLKKNSKHKTLFRLYKIIRSNYLFKQVLRLKELGFKEKTIIEIMKLNNNKELTFVKRDINILIKEISEKDKEFRKKLVSGIEISKILDYHFQNNIIKESSSETLKTPFSILSSFNLFEKIKREISYARSLWTVR
ncbi:V-type ATPase subunit [Candidatus Woesearchaeota archaeon]|nr:V-type ATPase subunit [Candidatus Woesearchaeota archaeon]